MLKSYLIYSTLNYLQNSYKLSQFKTLHKCVINKCCFLVVSLPADDQGGMGGPAEDRTRGKRAEAEGEARQRGETGPRMIETKRIISSSSSSQVFLFPFWMGRLDIVQHQPSIPFVKCVFALHTVPLKNNFLDWVAHAQPSNSLTKDAHKENKPSALTTWMYLLLKKWKSLWSCFAWVQKCSNNQSRECDLNARWQICCSMCFSPAVFLHHL